MINLGWINLIWFCVASVVIYGSLVCCGSFFGAFVLDLGGILFIYYG